MCCMLVNKSLAQDLEQSVKEAKNTIKQEPVSLSGSIGANTVFYKANGIAPRRDPFYWVLTANLNVSLFNKISVPFTAVITQQDKNYSNGLDKFSQPFNQFGISPKYKWLTVHAGFRTVDFSEYTLSGAMFLGGGIEIKPEKSFVSGTAIFGRFVKAVPKGGVDGIVVSLPAYERWGGGAKIKIGNDLSFAELIFLKIKDNVNSISFDTYLSVTPQENQVFAITTRQRISKWLGASADIAYSMFTKNLYEEVSKIERFTYVNQIYSPRPSSQFNKAINAGLDFSPGKYRLGLKYKRIDPDYRTLGSVFLTNDVEELSLNANFAFLKNKMNVNAASGVQRNNLDKIQLVTSQRAIGSLNVSYAINDHLNFSINYSNFSSNTLPVRDAFSDSIKFVQLTQNGGLSTNYSFGKNKLKHNLSNVLNYQESGGNKQGLTTFFNESIAYSIQFDEIGLNLNASFLYNKSTNAGFGVNEGLGPNLGIQKGLYKNKIRLMLSIGYQNSYLAKESINKNYIYNFNFSFTVNKHQSLKASCSYLDKKAIRQNAQQFSEVRGSLAYVYNFGIKSKKLVS